MTAPPVWLFLGQSMPCSDGFLRRQDVTLE
jgi:hypothetical protein